MAVEVAMEDDLFLADLNRQISLLIDDDGDDQVSHFPSVSHQGYYSRSSMIHPPMMLPTQYNLYQQNCRREITSKGTGVFIPQSSQPRRRPYKQHQGKRATASYNAKANNNKQQQQQLNNLKGRSNNGGANTNYSSAY